MDETGKLFGARRDDELLDFKAELERAQAKVVDPSDDPDDGAFIVRLISPDAPPEHFEVFQKLFLPLKLHEDPFDTQPHSPTPGDPYRVMMVDGNTYETGAMTYMAEKLENVAQKTGVDVKELFGAPHGLTRGDYDAIKHEIERQHTVQMSKNDAAFDRLRKKFKYDPSSINLDEADLIEKGRSIEATSIERAVLLATHPEMDAIEDMKFTCVLDNEAYSSEKKQYLDELVTEFSGSERFVIILVDKTEQVARPRDLRQSAPKEVKASKTVIAQIFDSKTGQVVEVVEKLNQYAFPLDRHLNGVTPNIVGGKNVQPIYTQICQRIRRDRTGELEDEMSEAKYNEQNLVIVELGSRRRIEDLRSY